MRQKYLEAGEIVNTHGIRGELKVMPWCDGPEFLKAFRRVYIEEKEYRVQSARVQKNMLLLKLDGIDDVNAAQTYRNKIVKVDRADAPVEEGRVFIADILGLPVFADGAQIGVLDEVMSGPANDVYVVKGEKEYLIPAVSAFLERVDPDEGVICVRLLEGMEV